MKISSKFKKIISVMMCCVVVLIPCLSTFAKGEAGDWGDDTYHEAYEDFKNIFEVAKLKHEDSFTLDAHGITINLISNGYDITTMVFYF